MISTCEYCKKEFINKRKYKCCSKECGLKFSGHKTKNLSIVKGLKVREDWKYKEIKELLNNLNIVYELEYKIDGLEWIYDLALFKFKILIEFDSYKHLTDPDLLKESDAEKLGWKIFRLETKKGEMIDKGCLENFLRKEIFNRTAPD